MMLQLDNVSVAGRVEVCSLSVDAGSQVHIIGPNGAGKSSLLARIAGLLPGSGEIRLNDLLLLALSARQQALQRAYLSQHHFPSGLMPVFQYLMLHQPLGATQGELAQTMEYLCQRLKLIAKLHCLLTQLSGGEWQRVRLAAALLQAWPSVNPVNRLLLLDEPTNNLDVAQHVALAGLLREYCQSGRIVLLCCHDINYTVQQANQVLVLKDSQIVAYGNVRDIMTANLLGRIYDVNFASYNIEGHHWIMAK